MKKRLSPARITLLIIFALLFVCGATGYFVVTISLEREQASMDELYSIVLQEPFPTSDTHPASDTQPAGSEQTSSSEMVAESENNQPTEEKPISVYPLYELNSDTVGWLSIPDTPVNYPVMYTPGEGEYYLRRDFYGNYSFAGTPFLDWRCDLDLSDNLIIYSHNMSNRTMFGSLREYADKSYWEQYPTIVLTTLEEEREYAIIASFYGEIFAGEDKGFEYYNFISAANAGEFDAYLEKLYSAACYDTGIAAKYGEQLLTLSTCDSWTENGRFAVVAKRIK